MEPTDMPLFDDESSIFPPYWQALGQLVCAAANAEHILRSAYYALAEANKGPAVAEGEMLERLISMCSGEAKPRSDYDEDLRIELVNALAELRKANKIRNRLFHDSWMFTADGGAVQTQSIRRGLMQSRKVWLGDVEAGRDLMVSATSRLMRAFINLTGGGFTQFSIDDAGQVVYQRNREDDALDIN